VFGVILIIGSVSLNSIHQMFYVMWTRRVFCEVRLEIEMLYTWTSGFRFVFQQYTSSLRQSSPGISVSEDGVVSRDAHALLVHCVHRKLDSGLRSGSWPSPTPHLTSALIHDRKREGGTRCSEEQESESGCSGRFVFTSTHAWNWNTRSIKSADCSFHASSYCST
jgi:hypothetical protein